MLLPDEQWERYIAQSAAGPSVGPVELDESGAPVAKDEQTTKELRALHDEVRAAVAQQRHAASLKHADLTADPEAPRG